MAMNEQKTRLISGTILAMNTIFLEASMGMSFNAKKNKIVESKHCSGGGVAMPMTANNQMAVVVCIRDALGQIVP